MLDRLALFKGVNRLATHALEDTRVDELKFKDTTSTVEILGLVHSLVKERLHSPAWMKWG